MNKTTMFAVIACLGAVACGKEVGRVVISSETTAQQDFPVTAGKTLALWTALDVEYTGTFAASYEVDLIQGGAVVAKATCNPLDAKTKMNMREVTLNDHHSVRYSGKMGCEVTPTSTGTATLKTKLTFTTKPKDLVVKDMSLVAKQ